MNLRTLAEFRQAGIDPPLKLLLQADEWQPLLNLVNAWLSDPISAETGIDVAEIKWHEQASGRRWPAALREWLQLMGTHPLHEGEDVAECPMPLKRMGESDRLLTIYTEIQEVWRCGILNEHCHLADPPIYFDSSVFDAMCETGYAPASVVDGRFVKVADSLTEFVLAMTVRQIGIGTAPVRNRVHFAKFSRDADMQPLLARGDWKRAIKFPTGYDPFTIGNDLILLDHWGIAARNAELFEPYGELLRSQGGLEYLGIAETIPEEIVWQEREAGE